MTMGLCDLCTTRPARVRVSSKQHEEGWGQRSVHACRICADRVKRQAKRWKLKAKRQRERKAMVDRLRAKQARRRAAHAATLRRQEGDG